MARKSKVTALPGKLKTTVDRLLSTGRFTLDQIIEHLMKLADAEGIPAEALPSRSALGRYALNFEKLAGRMREAREVAGAIVEKFGVEPDGDVGRLLQELLKTIAFQTLGEAAETGAEAKDVMFLSAAIKNLAATGKIDAEARQKIRQVAREEAQREAATAAAESMKRQGLSADTIKQIERDILGVAT